MRKELLIHAIHLGEVCHIVQEHIDLDHLCDVGASFFEDCDDVIAAGGGFIGDRALDEVALVVGRDLAGDVDLGSCDYGLGLEVCQLGFVVWGDADERRAEVLRRRGRPGQFFAIACSSRCISSNLILPHLLYRPCTVSHVSPHL